MGVDAEPVADGPVTTTVTRRIKPGHEAAYEGMASRCCWPTARTSRDLTKANEHMAKAAGPITVNRDLSPSNTISIHKPLVIGAWTTLGQGGKTQ
jgi:hypothetical protein